MAAPTTPADLLDLRMMPAWANEPAGGTDYSQYEGEQAEQPFERRGPRPPRNRAGGPRRPKARERGERQRERSGGPRDRGKQPDGERREHRRDDRRPRHDAPPMPAVGVRFLPHPAALESVIAQMKASAIAYSVFALARMFLDRPERYNVQLTAPAESPLQQLGENGPVAVDRRILEGSAFGMLKEDFYNIEVTQTEPVKGNFSNVARDRVSGVLLGPTNHHSYQPSLRALFEQRYSRRMSFQEFQRQIEIVSDPAVVEQWKEQARSVTKFTSKDENSPVVFSSAAEAERHFRQTHLPSLLRTANELTISGVISRRLPDRALGRVIENAWSAEMRSPSKMMQELAGALRGAGLNIFRHRRGMLFVSPIRVRAFAHERTSVSPSINAILEKLGETPGVNRKQLAEKLIEGLSEEAERDRVKLSLAAHLRWLISEGYVIEFNDGSLDLPRAKPPPPAQPASETKSEPAATETQPEVAAEETNAITPAEQAIASDEVQQNAGSRDSVQPDEEQPESVAVAVVESIQPASAESESSA